MEPMKEDPGLAADVQAQPLATPKQSALRWTGLLMSLFGFLGIVLQVLDFFVSKIDLGEIMSPVKVLLGCVVLVVLGSVLSNLFGPEAAQRSSKTLFVGSFMILFLIGVLVLVIGGIVLFFMMQLSE
jgi:hypothetical protein